MMISKELFVKYLSQYQIFNAAFERIEEALMGRKYSSNMFESDWCESVGYMLDIFLESHFTKDGCDLINAWLFEDCQEFWIKDTNEHYEYHSLEELYDVMLKFKNDYFLNA